ncbi:hypothetical protein [Funiculus sociatus]
MTSLPLSALKGVVGHKGGNARRHHSAIRLDEREEKDKMHREN